MDKNEFNVTWYSVKTNDIFVIGFLNYYEAAKVWEFFYNANEIEKAKEIGFALLPEFLLEEKKYYSDQLFTTFARRIKNINREGMDVTIPEVISLESITPLVSDNLHVLKKNSR